MAGRIMSILIYLVTLLLYGLWIEVRRMRRDA